MATKEYSTDEMPELMERKEHSPDVMLGINVKERAQHRRVTPQRASMMLCQVPDSIKNTIQ